MNDEFRIVIPARFASTRLPGKPLRRILGKPMIEWVYRAAQQTPAAEIVVATDDKRILEAVESFGGKACMTDSRHASGTDRILEVTQLLNWSSETVVVNLQGDEPLMPAVNISQVAENLVQHGCDIATLYKQVDARYAEDPNLVKLVHDHAGKALYFSRSRIPYQRGSDPVDYLGHIGIYAYRAGFIKIFSGLQPDPLELAESLEQLRALANGYSIHSELARAEPGPGIDTEQDLARVEQMMESKPR